MDLSNLWKGITSLVAVGLRAFVLTLGGMIGLGILLAAVGFYLASQTSTTGGVLAALAALVASTVLGFYVAGQRAVAAALIRGLRDYRYGEALVKLLFERILRTGTQQAKAEGTGVLARTAERLPLAQAETRLTEGLTAFLQAPVEGGGFTGWLRRKLQGRLLRLVRECTLTRFREASRTEGGVDLVKVQANLGKQIDEMVIARVRSAATRVTALVIIVAVLVAVGSALVLKQVSFWN